MKLLLRLAVLTSILAGIASITLAVISLTNSVNHYYHPPAPRFAISRDKAIPTHGKPLFGVYGHGFPPNWAPIEQFSQMTGTHVSLAISYVKFGGGFQTSYARTAARHGATAVVQIDPWRVSLNTIARGGYDRWLRKYALHWRYYEHPVIIGFSHEMNGKWYPWGYGHQSPASFIAAWRHVVSVFRAQGADNVTWMWTINRNGIVTGQLRDWWPGANYVDWIGVDGYYFHANQTFQDVFQPTIAEIRHLTDKPILLSEVGIGQQYQRSKLPGLLTGIKRDHLLGMIWFNVCQHQGVHHQCWVLTPKAAHTLGQSWN